MEAHWTEQVLTEAWLRGPDEAYPEIPEATILDEHTGSLPETNPRRMDASQVPREGNDDE